MSGGHWVLYGKWKPWFAWHPVQLSGGKARWIWLRRIERQQVSIPYCYFPFWNYRERSKPRHAP